MNQEQKLKLRKIENTSGWEVVEYKVMVQPDEIEEQSDGGIYIPEEARQRLGNAQVTAVIVAIGNKAFHELGYMLKVGQRVMIAKYAGIYLDKSVTDDGGDYRIVNDKDILAAKTGSAYHVEYDTEI